MGTVLWTQAIWFQKHELLKLTHFSPSSIQYILKGHPHKAYDDRESKILLWPYFPNKNLGCVVWQIVNWLKVQHSENKDHGIQSHHFMANRWRNSGNSCRLYLLGLQNHSLQIVVAAMKLKDAYSLGEKLDLDSILKSRGITLTTKVYLVKAI